MQRRIRRNYRRMMRQAIKRAILGKPPPKGKATGGYVTQGIYKVGE